MSKKDGEPYVIQVNPAPALRPAPTLEEYNRDLLRAARRTLAAPPCPDCKGFGVILDAWVSLSQIQPCPFCLGTGSADCPPLRPPAKPSRRSRGPRKVDWEM